MDQIRAMRVFVRVAERGSLTAASLDLGLSRGGASAIVTELEKYLGVQLIERTTRSLRLTEDGQYYLEKARAITEAVTNLEDEVGSAERQPRGQGESTFRKAGPGVSKAVSALAIRSRKL